MTGATRIIARCMVDTIISLLLLQSNSCFGAAAMMPTGMLAR